MYVVEHHWHAMAGGFGQSHISGNHRFEYLSAEKTPKIGRNLLRKGGPVIVHREENALDRERWIDCASKTSKRVQEF